MAAPAVLRIDIVADASKAAAGLGKVGTAADRAGDQAVKSSSKWKTATGRITSTLGKVGTAVAGAFAVDKVVGFAKDSITAASDLSETLSKTVQIFGASSDAITDWSKNSSEALGLSQKDALDAAGTFAIFGKAAGLSGADLAKFSESLTGTAADFASFANTTPQEAVEAIGAALRGETEPIRKYGLMLDDATIKNEAMRLGLIKTTKVPIDPKKRGLAVKALIDSFAKGQHITGDFARTSGGLANQQRIMAAKMENVKATIGTKLLPVMLVAITTFQTLATWIAKNSKLVLGFAVALGVLWAVMKVGAAQAGLEAAGGLKAWLTQTKLVTGATRIWAGVQAAFNAIMALNPVVLIVAALVLLGVALVIAYKKSVTFRNIVQAAFRGVQAAARVLWSGIKVVFGALATAFHAVASAAQILWSGIKVVFGAIVSAARVMWTVLKVIFTVLAVLILIPLIPLYLLGRALVALWQKSEQLRDTVADALGAVVSAFASVARAVAAALVRVTSIITAPFRAAWAWIRDVMLPALKGAWRAVAGAVSRGLSTVARAITAPFRAAWAWIRDSLIPALKGAWTSVAGAVGRGLSAVRSAITAPFSAAWAWIKLHVVSPMRSMFTGLAGAISRAMGGVFDAIIGPFQSAWHWIRDNVVAPIKSAWNGIAGAINSIHFSVKAPSWVPGIGGKGWSFDPPNIPTLARGGYVDRATLAVIGERGGEIVAPVAMLRQLMREETGPTIVVNGALDPDAVARQIERLLLARQRRTRGVTRVGATAVGT